MTEDRFQAIQRAAKGEPACEAELRRMLAESVKFITRLARELDFAKAHLADARRGHHA